MRISNSMCSYSTRNQTSFVIERAQSPFLWYIKPLGDDTFTYYPIFIYYRIPFVDTIFFQVCDHIILTYWDYINNCQKGLFWETIYYNGPKSHFNNWNNSGTVFIWRIIPLWKDCPNLYSHFRIAYLLLNFTFYRIL